MPDSILHALIYTDLFVRDSTPDSPQPLPVEGVSSTSEQLRDDSELPDFSLPLPAHLEPSAQRCKRELVQVLDMERRQAAGPGVRRPQSPVYIPTGTGWHHLQAYLNADGSLTEAGREQVTFAKERAQSQAAHTTIDVDLPIMLAYIAATPAERSASIKFGGYYGLKHGIRSYVDIDGSLTSRGISKAYKSMKKEFVEFTPKHLEQWIGIHLNASPQQTFTEIDGFKKFAINPLTIRSYVRFRSFANRPHADSQRGWYQLSKLGIDFLGKNHVLSRLQRALPVSANSANSVKWNLAHLK